jgi:hypothetical protein
MTQQQEIANMLRELAHQLDAMANQIESNKLDENMGRKVGAKLFQATLLATAQKRIFEDNFSKAQQLIVRVRHMLTANGSNIVG